MGQRHWLADWLVKRREPGLERAGGAPASCLCVPACFAACACDRSGCAMRLIHSALNKRPTSTPHSRRSSLEAQLPFGDFVKQYQLL